MTLGGEHYVLPPASRPVPTHADGEGHGHAYRMEVQRAPGADEALDKLEKLSRDYLINLHDAAVVSWEVGKKKPTTHEMHDTTKSGALGGAFWGMLFGLIFFVPFLGAAVGAATGALFGSMRDVGSSGDCLREVRGVGPPGR